jgi:uridylate kinase
MKKYKRILLKLSGEALLGKKSFGIDYSVLDEICSAITEVHQLGVEIVIVIGAGNIWRGSSSEASGIDRVPSDYIGMLGTVMNSLALQANLEKKHGIQTRVCSALDIPSVAEAYITRRVLRHLQKKRIVICAAGTGNPYFTTDSAAALRALELQCDILMKATNVDGVYSADPKKDPNAKKYDEITYTEILEHELRVMDATAIAQCRDNNMPLLVFELLAKGAMKKAVQGKKIGTKVKK